MFKNILAYFVCLYKILTNIEVISQILIIFVKNPVKDKKS
jgi:hypothetical protein